MRHFPALSAIILVTFMIISGQLSAKDQPIDAAVIAKDLIALVEANKFDEARQRFNPELQKALNSQALSQVQAQMEAAGAAKSITPTKTETRDGMVVVAVRIERTAATVVATVAIDSNGQVAGLHYGPAP